MRWRRLPARISIFAPTALRLLTRAVSCTRTERDRLPPSLRRRRISVGVRNSASMSPSPSTSAVARRERLQVRAHQARARGDVQPARAEIPEHANAAGRGRQQIEQAIVVVIHELRGVRTRGVSIGGADDIAAAAVAHRELTGVAAGMKEVDVPVLVDVARRRHAGGTFEGQADLAGRRP